MIKRIKQWLTPKPTTVTNVFIINENQDTETKTYNDNGNLTYTEDSDGEWMRISYDKDNQPIHCETKTYISAWQSMLPIREKSPSELKSDLKHKTINDLLKIIKEDTNV